MKMDKKTLVQIIALFVLVVGAAYYFLYYVPVNERIVALENDKTAKENELMQKQMKASVEKSLDDQILAASDYVENMGRVLFVDMKPEEALKLAGKFNKGGKIVFDNVSTSLETDAELQFSNIQQQLSFTADYYDVMEYMRTVRRFDKRIAISAGSFSLLEYDDFEEDATVGVSDGTADEDADNGAKGGAVAADGNVSRKPETNINIGTTDGNTSDNNKNKDSTETAGNNAFDKNKNTSNIVGIGESASDSSESAVFSRGKSYKLVVNLVLNYRSLPMLAQFGNRDEQLIKDIKSKRELAKGPFSKYADYIAAIRLEKERQSVANTTEAITFTFNNVESGGSTDGGYNSFNPRTVVNGFDDNAFFFVASDPDVKGSVTRSLIRKNGSHSADLLFDFITAKESNVANIVFEKEQRLNAQPANVYMQVYAFESSNHSIGMVLLDSAGREFRVTLAEAVDWVEWNEISATLPEGITYPCVIQRIFVEGVGYGQKTTGRYIFDQLEIDYPQPNFEY